MQKKTARKAVDPIIASLLLIAIAVAAGIIVYVYVNSLAGGLTQSGGQQVSDQIAMDAYNYATIGSAGGNGATVTVRDVGSSTVTINAIFFDGQVNTLSTSPAAPGCATGASSISPSTSCTFILLNPNPAPTSGTSHAIKILTSTGGTAVFTIVAGRSG